MSLRKEKTDICDVMSVFVINVKDKPSTSNFMSIIIHVKKKPDISNVMSIPLQK